MLTQKNMTLIKLSKTMEIPLSINNHGNSACQAASGYLNHVLTTD
jgi:hypothetical protein